MAKILSLIPPQRFEVVRDRIGEILTIELAEQFLLSDDPGSPLAATVWLERFVSLDFSEMPAVNVQLGRGDYGNKDQTQVDGTYVYYIDCYTSAPSSSDANGDTLATLRLHRLVGVCRAILENPVYRTLGYAPPFLCEVAVTSISIGQPDNEKDAASQIQGRIEFTVRVPETVALGEGLPLAGNDTTVKLELTNKGYRWTHNHIVGVIPVQDTDLLPATDIGIVGIDLGGTVYQVDEVFADRAALLAYLNTTLQPVRVSDGVFTLQGNIIYYSNPENFETAEIMAIYQSEMRCYQVGTPGELSSEFTPIPVSGPVTVDALKASVTDARVLAVFIGSQFSEPVASADLTSYNNINIYLLVQQTP